MVIFLRVDERLIHGQVALSWNQQLSPDAIVVINDAIMHDEIQKIAIKMAKPSNVKLAIKNVKDGIELLNNPQTEKMRLFVVVRNTRDALEIVKNVKGIKEVNVGGMTKKTFETIQIASYLYVTKEDIENLKEIQNYVDFIDCRVVPGNKKCDIFKLIK